MYTDPPTETLQEALVGVMDYGTRFLVEEFHQGPQDRNEDRGVAVGAGQPLVRGDRGDERGGKRLRLLDLRELGRAFPDAPAACTGLDELELELLSLAVERELTTVAEVLLAVGRLGGHMNRRGDGMPGWITLWRGMKMLRLLVRGAKLERARMDAHAHHMIK